MFEVVILLALLFIGLLIVFMIMHLFGEQDELPESNQEPVGQQQAHTQENDIRELTIGNNTIPISADQLTPSVFAPINDNLESYIEQATDDEPHNDNNLRPLQESYREDFNDVSVNHNVYTWFRYAQVYRRLDLGTVTAVRHSHACGTSIQNQADCNSEDLEHEQGQQAQPQELTMPKARGTGDEPDETQPSPQIFGQFRQNDHLLQSADTESRTPMDATSEPTQSNTFTSDKLTVSTANNRLDASQHQENISEGPSTLVNLPVGRESSPLPDGVQISSINLPPDDHHHYQHTGRITRGRDGKYHWRILKIKEKMEQAISGKVPHLESEPFVHEGYKMSAKVYLNGKDEGAGSHVSLYFHIRKSDGACILRWPFPFSITMTFVDQETGVGNISKTIEPDLTSQSFQQPTEDMNILKESPQFVPQQKLSNTNYIKDDTMLLNFKVG